MPGRADLWTADALAEADADWPRRLITRGAPMGEFVNALSKHDDDVKIVVDLTVEEGERSGPGRW